MGVLPDASGMGGGGAGLRENVAVRVLKAGDRAPWKVPVFPWEWREKMGLCQVSLVIHGGCLRLGQELQGVRAVWVGDEARVCVEPWGHASQGPDRWQIQAQGWRENSTPSNWIPAPLGSQGAGATGAFWKAGRPHA